MIISERLGIIPGKKTLLTGTIWLVHTRPLYTIRTFLLIYLFLQPSFFTYTRCVVRSCRKHPKNSLRYSDIQFDFRYMEICTQFDHLSRGMFYYCKALFRNCRTPDSGHTGCIRVSYHLSHFSHFSSTMIRHNQLKQILNGLK